MNKVDKQYQDLLSDILDNGHQKGDRTGTGTVSVFGREMRFNMSDGFPLLTTKKVYHKGVIHELLWMLGAMPKEYKQFGNTNIKYLVDNGVNIWVGDAYREYQNKRTVDEIKIMGYPKTEKEFIERIKEDENFALTYGNLGPVYGEQWTNWVSETKSSEHLDGNFEIVEKVSGVNQIQEVIDRLKENPDCRRLIVSAWNVGQIKRMALPPCHLLFQFWTRELSMSEKEDWCKHNDNHMDCPMRAISVKMYQRSCDTFLGVPFNIASYALLLEMVAQCVNMVPEEFIWSGGDTHIYNNHIDQCKEQISREPKKLPTILLNSEINDIFAFRFSDITIKDYEPHPKIKGELST
jgi:thymidylate synthase